MSKKTLKYHSLDWNNRTLKFVIFTKENIKISVLSCYLIEATVTCNFRLTEIGFLCKLYTKKLLNLVFICYHGKTLLSGVHMYANFNLNLNGWIITLNKSMKINKC